MLNMEWSDKAAANAKKWADECQEQHSTPPFRNTGNGILCGENLFMSSHPVKWSTLIQSWYNEVKHWKFGVGAIDGAMIGHYLQIVTYKSKEVGCAYAYCPNNKLPHYYVCHYCPHGDINPEEPWEPGQPCGACKDSCSDGLCDNGCKVYDLFRNCEHFKWACPFFAIFRDEYCPATCQCDGKVK
ncbi:serotriflin-like [Xyrichtys novacula]|nr:serotriflin-like [Xyrichtys novacula]